MPVMQQQKVQSRIRINELMGKRMQERGEKLTRRQLADAVGITPITVSNWSNKPVDVLDLSIAYRLCDYFGCTLDELVERVE